MPKKIVRFTAHDVLRLSAVEITPAGNVVTLGGENGAGKSSVLNAIAMALAGKRFTPAKPVRTGAERASVVLDLGDVEVERVITKASDRLEVRAKGGAVFKRPQEMLNKLFAAIAFDPLAFVSQEPGQQAETLRKLTGLDTSAIDRERQHAYDERTVVGREHKRLEAVAASMPEHEGPLPPTELTMADLIEELRRVEADKGDRQQVVDEVTKEEQAVAALTLQIDKAEREIALLQAQLTEVRPLLASRTAALERLKVDLASIPEPDSGAVQERMRGAEEINRKVRANAARAAAHQAAEAEGRKYAALTAHIETLDLQKAEAVAATAFPVPGLTFGPDGVLFNDEPFEQASRAEQIRVSLAVGIAMNPELRVLFVRDGSLLDKKGLALVAQMAEEHDCQIWIEDARTSDPAAVMIEDGHVLGAPPPAPAALEPMEGKAR